MLKLVIQGLEYPVDLDTGRITVGRHGSNTVVLAGLDVSGLHAEIRCGEGGAYLADLGSTNGTKVNGRRLTKPKKLSAGDRVGFGSTEAEVVATEVHGPDPRLPAVRLVVLRGMASTSFVLDKDRVLVGRAPENDVVLPVGSVSARHARLERADGGWRLTDLGSTNGTFVGSSRAAGRTLVPGTAVRFGGVELKLVCDSGAPPSRVLPAGPGVRAPAGMRRAPAWAWAGVAIAGAVVVALGLLLLLNRDQGTGTPSRSASGGGGGGISGAAASGRLDVEEAPGSGSPAARGSVPAAREDATVGPLRRTPELLAGRVAAGGQNDGREWSGSARGFICLEGGGQPRRWTSTLSRGVRGSVSLVGLASRGGDLGGVYVRPEAAVAVISANDCPIPYITTVASAPTGGVGFFRLASYHRFPWGIAYADGHLYVTSGRDKVYAYSRRGERVPRADFVLSSEGMVTGIVYAKGLFYVVEANVDVVRAYGRNGRLDSTFDLALSHTAGIAFADGRFYVLDSTYVTAYAYGSGGERRFGSSQPSRAYPRDGDIRLDAGQFHPGGITHARGTFFVTDSYRVNKVYAYDSRGERVPAADFDLQVDNEDPGGIAYAEGCFYVVDRESGKVFAYGDGDTDRGGTSGSCLR